MVFLVEKLKEIHQTLRQWVLAASSSSHGRQILKIDQSLAKTQLPHPPPQLLPQLLPPLESENETLSVQLLLSAVTTSDEA